MRKELKSIAEYRKPGNDAFASVTRSFGEANNRFQALAVESVGRAVEIQSQFVAKAYDTYISEISKLGRMFFVGTQPSLLGHKHCHMLISTKKKAADRQQGASAEANVNPEPARRRTAAQSMTTKRKTGTVAKSQSGSKRSAKAKRKAGSVRRSKV